MSFIAVGVEAPRGELRFSSNFDLNTESRTGILPSLSLTKSNHRGTYADFGIMSHFRVINVFCHLSTINFRLDQPHFGC